MGSGSFNLKSYANYSVANHKVYNHSTGRIDSGQEFKSVKIDQSLDPKNFKVRECCNNEEHPNTIPVILGLDVTGSMGDACMETANALGVIITNLYEKYKDIEFCIMGIGDLAYDNAPIQMSQFESDVRIAEALDKLYMEHGGGGNGFESYTAAWYMGLYHTKLDCWEQGRKGIIITMGDEPLNPYLPIRELRNCIGSKAVGESNVETKDLYKNVSEKFDIFHIAVNGKNCYKGYKDKIQKTFGEFLGGRFKISTIDELAGTIEQCISESIEGTAVESSDKATVNDKGEISW